MKIVKLEVLPMNAGEVVTATVRVEGGKTEAYENTVESGTPQASQTIILSDDQKVVIEGKVEDQIELDRDQMSARKKPLGKKAEEQQKKDEEQKKKFEKMNKDEEERLEKEMPEELKLRKAQEKERDEKIMGKQDQSKQSGSGMKADSEPQPPSGGRDAGLRHEVPADSKTVSDHGSTTRSKR